LTFRIQRFRWHATIIDKVIGKHGVNPESVESALWNTDPAPYVERLGDRYVALAQDEASGECLFIVLALESGEATVITARRMTNAEVSRFRKLRGS
jgi:uncharacterized DUF497 family protein